MAQLPPHALLAAGHRLARRKSIALSELAREPHVLLDLPLSREYFMQLFGDAGLEPDVAMRSEHPETIRTLVANGFGYAIVNALPRTGTALDGSPGLQGDVVGDPVKPAAHRVPLHHRSCLARQQTSGGAALAGQP